MKIGNDICFEMISTGKVHVVVILRQYHLVGKINSGYLQAAKRLIIASLFYNIPGSFEPDVC